MGRTPQRPTAPGQRGGIALDPAEPWGMVTPHATCPPEVFPVALAPRAAEIPPHGAAHEISWQVVPLA